MEPDLVEVMALLQGRPFRWRGWVGKPTAEGMRAQ